MPKFIKQLRLLLAVFLIGISSLSFAAAPLPPLSQQQLQSIINHSGFEKSFSIQATPPVLAKINFLRTNPGARMSMQATLNRLNQDLPLLKAHLHEQGLPDTLLAIPIIESDYQVLACHQNRGHAGGAWQILPSTARLYGLSVHAKKDDRFDINLESQAAARYLSDLYGQLHDWKFVVAGYTMGGGGANRIMHTHPNADTATLLKSPGVPRAVKTYLTRFDVAAIVLANPDIIST